MQVAVIDFEDPQGPQAFTRSLKETGFAVVNNHPISAELVTRVYTAWQGFFEGNNKEAFLFNPEQQDGYFPFGTENAKGSDTKDLKEFYHYYTWGRVPDQLEDATRTLYTALDTLAGKLLEWVEGELPPEVTNLFYEPLRDMIINSHRTLLRTIYYPALTGSEEAGAIRAAAHEDINLITLLVGATEAGLEVQGVNGNWYPVPCDPGMIAVNTGDMLQMASNGFLPSTTHRVVNPTGTDSQRPRLSMPLFLHPRDDVLLNPETTAKSYLDERLREIGLK
ncbi:MAG: isopenicillin N synthase family oxygenase [Candidatus Marinimicrobia bacterium]|nr:isopenicillin N synthase family oxygenase [Candidatus Neomarinimicrobiota bacterium]MCF7904457.1 isopenicillin N synthase family oxygenase [Candidatus Neomarinimicrobiota bacterium]